MADTVRYHLEPVAAALAAYKDSFDSVTFEYPGVIHVHADGAVWVIGNANGPIGADYYASADALVNGEPPNASIEIDNIPDGTSFQRIAAEIVHRMETADV